MLHAGEIMSKCNERMRDAGWVFEYRAGVNEYQKILRSKLLRIREVGTRAEQGYSTYSGTKYLGTFRDLDEARRLAEKHR